MLDLHERIIGIMPYIFGFSSYSIFVMLGIIAGVIYYFTDAKKRGAR